MIIGVEDLQGLHPNNTILTLGFQTSKQERGYLEDILKEKYALTSHRSKKLGSHSVKNKGHKCNSSESIICVPG